MSYEKLIREQYEKCPSCGRSTQNRDVSDTENKFRWVCKNCNWRGPVIISCSIDYIEILRKIKEEKSK